MCSWCWGFAPEIEDLAEEHPVEVVVGGLRPGPAAQVLEDRLAGFLSHHWSEIAERTGQPFDLGFLERRDGWIYDTEPAAIGVVTMRSLSPVSTLPYFTTVQEAFYSKGQDVTDYSVLTDLATRFDVDAEEFGTVIRGDAAKKGAWSDFARARNWGISGFPALIAELPGEKLGLVARGWAPADVILTRLEGLTESYPA